MVLYFIGLGLGDEKDITVKGLEIVKKCTRVYLEAYTAVLGVNRTKLEQFYGRKVIEADRKMVEQQAEVIMKDSDKVSAVLELVFFCCIFVVCPGALCLSSSLHCPSVRADFVM